MARKLRHLVLLTVAGFLYYSGLLRFLSLSRRFILRKRGICVLALHRVLSEEETVRTNSPPGMVLRRKTFEKMLEFLNREFHIVSLDGFLERISSHHADPKPLCLLTFDDGWRDNYTTAYPLLRKFKCPAVIFLVTGFVGKSGGFWVEELRRAWQDTERQKQIRKQFSSVFSPGSTAIGIETIIEHLKHMPAKGRQEALAESIECVDGDGSDQLLNWQEIAAMCCDGIDFGSHTVTHPLLIYEDDQVVEYELSASKQAIEAKLGKKVQAFAYPNGTWDERIHDLVQKLGYGCAFITRRGWHHQGDDVYKIRRIILHEARVTGLGGRFSPAVLSLRLSGWC
jgi:peptidoglycan/xylan/chitin deacetylase (PgdA/CDA1 family)